jgi:hypothetical protein
MDVFVAILIFIGIVVVSVLFFGGWMMVAIVRLMARALGGGGRPYTPQQLPRPHGVICPYDNCRADNLAAARFCRRCGRPLSVPNRAVVRRVAMW